MLQHGRVALVRAALHHHHHQHASQRFARTHTSPSLGGHHGSRSGPTVAADNRAFTLLVRFVVNNELAMRACPGWAAAAAGCAAGGSGGGLQMRRSFRSDCMLSSQQSSSKPPAGPVPPADECPKEPVSSIADDHPVEDLVNDESAATQSTSKDKPITTSKTSEFNTSKGRLVVTTTNEGTDLKSVIIEKPADGKPSPVVEEKKLTEKDIRRRSRVDFNRSSLERNFITPTRAMSDFLLKPSDLENLPKTKRRSPYEQEPPITVYWRKDVEEKAIEVWGTRENLLRECLKREIERKMHQQNIFTVKRRLRDYRREIGNRTSAQGQNDGLTGRSGRVVLSAIAINMANFVFKLCAWITTQSHTMFAETIHSAADTINQIILAYGIHKSTQIADSDHPYGYTNMKYVTSLISGVAIFCGGAGLSVYHGIDGLIHPHPVGDFYWAFWILGGSLISEGATLVLALNSIRHSATKANMSFKDYVMRGEDPCVNVVLFEDSAALLSVVIAASCILLSSWTNSPVPDAVGSLLVGGVLAAVASYIIHSNSNALVGRSIPIEQLDRINLELESDVMIRAIHDVKGIDMGSSLVRYKAEMDFDGRELTRFYLEKHDLNKLLTEVQNFQSVDELESYMLKHGESIVDQMGGEIDRIEMKLRKKFPEIRHCDLEIL